jgi:hypothetical protein
MLHISHQVGSASTGSCQLQSVMKTRHPHLYKVVVSSQFSGSWHAFCETISDLTIFSYQRDDLDRNPALLRIVSSGESRLSPCTKDVAMQADLIVADMYPGFVAEVRAMIYDAYMTGVQRPTLDIMAPAVTKRLAFSRCISKGATTALVKHLLTHQQRLQSPGATLGFPVEYSGYSPGRPHGGSKRYPRRSWASSSSTGPSDWSVNGRGSAGPQTPMRGPRPVGSVGSASTAHGTSRTIPFALNSPEAKQMG